MKLVEIIGRGAMGVVYRGMDQVLGRAVAVKFLKPLEESDTTWKDRFLDEARAGAAVHHPNVVEIYQAGVAEGRPYLILQYVEGETLAHVLRRRGPLSLSLVAAILEETAAAVDELHRHGIIHRDLKPSNILLDSNGHVHVSDLGVSLRRADGKMADASFAGTPAFMAPEVFEGRASPRSDIYALGVTLFELLTGKAPFEGTSLELSRKHKEEQLPADLLAARQVPPGVIDVIGRAMHKQPAFRYKSAQDLSRAFVAALGRPVDPGKARIELAVLLSRPSGQAAPGDDPRGLFVEGSISSTISHIADLKRQRRLSGEQALPVPAPELRPLSGTLDADVPCVACTYNLRQLPPDGNCPECGKAVRSSLDPARTIFADASWLRGVVRGHSLAMLAVGLELVCFPHSHMPDASFGTLSLICMFPLLGGTWLMTRPRPTGSLRWARLSRAIVFIPVALALTTATSLASGSVGGQLETWQRFGLVVSMVAAPIAVLLCIGAIARSLPEPQGQRRLRRIAFVLILAGTILCGFWEVAVRGWISADAETFDLPAYVTIAMGYAVYLATLYESRTTLVRLMERRIAQSPPGQSLTLTCARCNYDLRGLSFDGECPECGLSIERSLDPGRTVFAKRQWLYGVVLGIGLVFVSLLFWIAAILLNWVMLSSPGQWWQTTWLHRLVWLQRGMLHTVYAWNLKAYIHELNDTALGLESVVCLAPAVLGIWLITRPRSGWHSTARSVCRYGALTTLGLAMFLATAALFQLSLGGWIVSDLSLDWQAPVRFGVGPVLAMVEVALAVALLWYLGCVVSSVPEPAAARFIRRSAILSLSTLIILMGLIRMGELSVGYGTLLPAGSRLARIITVLPALERLAALAGWILFITCLRRVGRMLLRLARQRRSRWDVADSVGPHTPPLPFAISAK